jgi:zinc and cadmium transporter
MPILAWIILSTLVVSLLAWAGLLVLVFKEEIIKKILTPLVAFAAGALLAGAMLHLIPEALELAGINTTIFLFILGGFSGFFILEQFIHWHHCHKAPSEHKTPVTYLVLIADTIHNFIDGIAIGSAFVADIKLGLVTWFAVAAHEIPQELGDFGILIHGGWQKKQALLFNFYSALAALLGGLVAYYLASTINVVYLLAFAAGSFIYIACSDLIPEIKHREDLKENIIHFFSFLFGIVLIWAVKFIS